MLLWFVLLIKVHECVRKRRGGGGVKGSKLDQLILTKFDLAGILEKAYAFTITLYICNIFTLKSFKLNPFQGHIFNISVGSRLRTVASLIVTTHFEKLRTFIFFT